MKSQKRDGSERAFNHGYKAAISGKAIHNNPHEKEELKLQIVYKSTVDSDFPEFPNEKQ